MDPSPESGRARDEPEQQDPHCPSRRPNGHHPEHAAAGHFEQGARQARPAAPERRGRRAAEARRAARAAACGSCEGLCRTVFRPSAGIRRGRAVRAARRLHRRGRRVPEGTPEPGRQAGLRDRAQAGGRSLSPALHGAPGRRLGLGGGMHHAGRHRLPPGFLPGRFAQLRGDRSAVDRRRRHRKSSLVDRYHRLLPRRAAERLHQGAAGAPAHGQRRRRHPAGGARHAFLRLQALSPGRRPAAPGAGESDQRHAGARIGRRL